MSKKYISKYITYKEYQCPCCNRLPPMFYDTDGQRKDVVPYVYNEFFDIFREIREKRGGAIPIGKHGKDGGYRCLKRQKQLYDQEISSEILSVHNFGLAFDCDCDDEYEVKNLVELIRKICPELRIGWRVYLYRGQSFVHMDVGYLIYPPYSKKLYRGASW